MTGDPLELSPDVRRKVDGYLDAVEQALRRGGASRDEAKGICDDLETQILDMLASWAPGRAPTPTDADVVLAQLDPPEAYAQGAGGRTAAPATAAALPGAALPEGAPPAPAPPKPKFCRTALWGLLGFVPLGAVCLLSPLLFFMGTMHVSMEPLQTARPPWWAEMSTIGIALGAIPLIGMIWMTVAGIMAVIQIRRSNDMLTGLWLAVFEAVVFPIIALVVLVLGVLACA